MVKVVVTKSLDRRLGMDAAAIDAAKTWRFTPGRDSSGNAVPVVVTIQFDLVLR